MCDLALYRDCDQGSTTISNYFIDEFLSEANDAQIKVYLYIIRMMASGLTTNISDMADKFNHTEKDICRALRYWEKKGLLSLDYDKNGGIVAIRLYEPNNRNSRTSKSVPVPVSSTVSIMNSGDIAECSLEDTTSTNNLISVPVKPTYSLDELKAFKNRQETPQLIFIAETYLKKTLTANDIRSILYYRDELHFSVDLIDYLLQFCAGRKKTTFAYMDKVATDWAENGINSVAQAKKYASNFGETKYSAPAKTNNIRSYSSSKKPNTAFHDMEQIDYDFASIERLKLSQK